MSHIGKALQSIRSRESQDDFAKSLGVSKTTIVNYEKGHRLPDIDFLVQVAKTQHVNLVDLIEERVKDSPVSDEDMLSASPTLVEQAIQDLKTADVMQNKLGEMRKAEATSGYVPIPLYNVRAAAGNGAVVGQEHVADALQFSEAWIRQELRAAPSDLYLIYVDGESMEPTLRAGDVILLDRRATKPDREGIYILRIDGMLLVKRLQGLPGGILKVSSDNQAYEAFTVRLAEMQDQDFAILGRVVWSGRRM